jgi:hypothetical protein
MPVSRRDVSDAGDRLEVPADGYRRLLADSGAGEVKAAVSACGWI